VVFELAGHPVRWRLLSELSWSDRRVRELTRLVGEPQPLVSYHLGKLRSAGLVSARRSSFDRRDSYYSFDLARYGELLVAAGAELHPALRHSWATPVEPQRRSHRPRVLFVCTGNSARSQIAEALLQHLSGEAVEVFSAGSRPKPLHPNAVRVLRARGIDISRRRSKHLSAFGRRRFDTVVSLCDRVREVCPEFPGEPQTIHWSIADPAASGGDRDTYPAFERTAAELETRIRFLLRRITDGSLEQEPLYDPSGNPVELFQPAD
jgi:protein-tyrosine-phosphatase